MAIQREDEYPPLLPLGFHSVELAELRQLCVARFPDSISRSNIMTGLESLVLNLNSEGLPMQIWIDGSFTTEKLNPEDVDLLVCVKEDDLANATEGQKQIIRRVAETDFMPSHRCDAYVLFEYLEGHPLRDEGEWQRAYWLRQFGYSRQDKPKGLAVLTLPYLVI